MPRAATTSEPPHPIHRLLRIGADYGHSAVGFHLATNIKRRFGLRYSRSELDSFYADGSIVKLSGRGLETALTTGDMARAGAVVATSLYRMAQEASQAGPLGLTPPEGATASQRAAWKLLCDAGWGVLTGGPGTGKTWLLAQLVDACRGKGIPVYCCAPTGKAASVLGLKVKAPVTTIHRLIRLVPGGKPMHDRHNHLGRGILIVDETSMVDEYLMAFLLDAVNPEHTRVIFSGDIDQLPPVSCGAPFQVMCKSPLVPTARLTEIVRQQEGSGILKLSRDITQGRFRIPATDVVHYPCAEGSKQAEQIAMNLYIEAVTSGTPPKEITILAPVKQQKFDASTGRMNDQISHKLFPKRTIKNCKFTVGDRIIFTVNDYHHGFVNGELGTLLTYDRPTKQATILNDTNKMYDLEDWNIGSYAEWAYALTIHKAQGSEADTVILVVTKAAPHMYTRRLIYTAVTRAKRKLIIVGDLDILRKAVSKTPQRLSCTTYMIENERLRRQHYGSKPGSKSLESVWGEF